MKSSEKKLTTRLPDYTPNKGEKVKPRKNLPLNHPNPAFSAIKIFNYSLYLYSIMH